LREQFDRRPQKVQTVAKSLTEEEKAKMSRVLLSVELQMIPQ